MGASWRTLRSLAPCLQASLSPSSCRSAAGAASSRAWWSSAFFLHWLSCLAGGRPPTCRRSSGRRRQCEIGCDHRGSNGCTRPYAVTVCSECLDAVHDTVRRLWTLVHVCLCAHVARTCLKVQVWGFHARPC